MFQKKELLMIRSVKGLEYTVALVSDLKLCGIRFAPDAALYALEMAQCLAKIQGDSRKGGV